MPEPMMLGLDGVEDSGKPHVPFCLECFLLLLTLCLNAAIFALVW